MKPCKHVVRIHTFNREALEKHVGLEVLESFVNNIGTIWANREVY